MKYLSIDCETTGINAENDQLISIGIIIEDTNNPLSFDEIPKFHCIIKRDRLNGNVFALNLNRELISNLNKYNLANRTEQETLEQTLGVTFLDEGDVTKSIYRFLYDNNYIDKPCTDGWSHALVGEYFEIHKGKSYPVLTKSNTPINILCAGKNFGTFDKIFLEKLPRWNEIFRIHRRMIDPVMLYVDWTKDNVLPNLPECKKRAGFDNSISHDALEDAWDVIQILRKKY